ncbi:MAG: hypothetical protein CMP23_05685 [Rickettsiales bacterium]|nr:hypothetical protein [Rickettsiales bacterium]|tara:strand:- start:986 stop:1720 length:735 start_codon:yes stop_codon:yes gene_type:complete
MSLSSELCLSNLQRLVEYFELEEILSEDGGPYLPLVSPMSPEPVGAMRIFSGAKVERAVYIGISVPAIGLDSHMLFAFAPSESALPHFTVDSVQAGPTYAFHLDLIPRVDLGTHLGWMDDVMMPLTPIWEEVQEWEGLTRAHIAPRQRAIMSPWMLVNRATEEAFEKMSEPVGAYLEHWLKLVENGVSESTHTDMTASDLARRDQENRALIFSPEVDKVWAQIERLLGPSVPAEMRSVLRGEAL